MRPYMASNLHKMQYSEPSLTEVAESQKSPVDSSGQHSEAHRGHWQLSAAYGGLRKPPVHTSEPPKSTHLNPPTEYESFMLLMYRIVALMGHHGQWPTEKVWEPLAYWVMGGGSTGATNHPAFFP